MPSRSEIAKQVSKKLGISIETNGRWWMDDLGIFVPTALRDALISASCELERERELRLKIVDFVNGEFFKDVPDSEDDGFGGGCVQPCHECGLRMMQVVRPGKVQCGLCG